MTHHPYSYASQIIYPAPLQAGDLIGIIAPSSGLEPEIHHLIHRSTAYLHQLGYQTRVGSSVWTNDKCVSLPKEQRAAELEQFLLNDKIKAIIPPWGGEFLMDILPLLNWEKIRQASPTWILGFSDISTLTFTYTLMTGYASAHGPGVVDISGADDHLTIRWQDLLSATSGQSIEQSSSTYHQTHSDYSKPNFNLDTPTEWKILGQEDQAEASLELSGRLIGGCMDVLAPLIGTPWAPVTDFIQHYDQEEGFIWYLESCEMNAGDIYRHLWQMNQAGWFQHTRGVLIGRPAGYTPVKNFELQDALQSVFGEQHIPVVYNVDIGHIPPQLTLINGASAHVHVSNGSGTVQQTLR